MNFKFLGSVTLLQQTGQSQWSGGKEMLLKDPNYLTCSIILTSFHPETYFSLLSDVCNPLHETLVYARKYTIIQKLLAVRIKMTIILSIVYHYIF